MFASVKKALYSLPFVVLALMSCNRHEDVCKVGFEARFVDFTADSAGCERLIQLEKDSTLLNPISGDLGLKIKDGKRFFVEFDTVQSTTTECDKSIPVHVTCISKKDK